MKVIRPTPITDAILVSSSVAETEYSVWSSGTAYVLGDRVIKSHRVWESAQAANTNHDPQDPGSTWWFDVGPTNRWAMFDSAVGSMTVASNSLTVELSPGRVDALALLQVYAASARVEMIVAGETVYDRVASMTDDSKVADWYMYFFDPIRPADFLMLDDLPVFGEGVIRVSLNNPAGEVRVGVAVAGMKSDLGGVLLSPSLSINDYSRKVTDDYGVTSLVPRSFSKRMSVRLIVDNNEIDRVQGVFSDLRATPSVWAGSDRYSSMLVYGFLRDFDIDVAYTNISYCSLNIEGMI